MRIAKLWTSAHSIALGFLLGVSVMTAAIWYAAPSKAQTVNQPIVIPIQNPSFELPSRILLTTDTCGLDERGIVQDWQLAVEPNSGGTGGVLQPDSCSIPTPPDGKTVAFLQAATITQDLGVSASEVQAGPWDGVYVMKFSVYNYYHGYPGYYEARILLGENELCSTDGWGLKTWTTISLSCPAPDYIVFAQWPNGNTFDPNAHLVISLSSDGWPVMFDAVSLTFTRESK